MLHNRIIGIDPGSQSCGMVILDDGHITAVFNIMFEQFWSKITNYLVHPNCRIAMEDIRPYSTPLTPQIVDTCKFIGEALYRLRIECGCHIELVTRYEVKKWVFDTFPAAWEKRIEKKIRKKAFTACDMGTGKEILVWGNGEKWKARKASFVFVDDKIVTEAMKLLYSIPLPPPGSGYRYGLKDDAWQALAVASLYNARLNQFVS